MPPIKVHIDDPITADSTEGDAQPNASLTGTVPTHNVDSSNSESASPYPPARPGAAAVPAPTPYLANPPQIPPTRTTQPPSGGPPPPQPGAVPVAPAHPVPPTAPSTLPPPPKAGEAPRTMPYQVGIPPPQQNYAPNASTTTGRPPDPPRAGPTTLNFGAAPPTAVIPTASRPEGYQQNLYAQEMNSVQRASLDQQERREGILPNLNVGGGGAGIDGSGAQETVENAWHAVKNWASVAGSKLAETEEQIWKRINGGS